MTITIVVSTLASASAIAAHVLWVRSAIPTVKRAS
jgi:hypothetical protein